MTINEGECKRKCNAALREFNQRMEEIRTDAYKVVAQKRSILWKEYHRRVAEIKRSHPHYRRLEARKRREKLRKLMRDVKMIEIREG